MTDGEALLAAILADPTDDTVRLVYADELERLGQQERAEFIRVQIAIARIPPLPGDGAGKIYVYTEEQYALMRRERELEWVRALAVCDWMQFTEFSRGFISAITCTAADWLQHADAILNQHPVEKVTLTTGSGSEQGIRIWEFQRQATIDLLNERWPAIEFEFPPPQPRWEHYTAQYTEISRDDLIARVRRGMQQMTLSEQGHRQRLVEARIEVRRSVALGHMSEEEGRRMIAQLDAALPVA